MYHRALVQVVEKQRVDLKNVEKKASVDMADFKANLTKVSHETYNGYGDYVYSTIIEIMKKNLNVKLIYIVYS